MDENWSIISLILRIRQFIRKLFDELCIAMVTQVECPEKNRLLAKKQEATSGICEEVCRQGHEILEESDFHR